MPVRHKHFHFMGCGTEYKSRGLAGHGPQVVQAVVEVLESGLQASLARGKN